MERGGHYFYRKANLREKTGDEILRAKHALLELRIGRNTGMPHVLFQFFQRIKHTGSFALISSHG